MTTHKTNQSRRELFIPDGSKVDRSILTRSARQHLQRMQLRPSRNRSLSPNTLGHHQSATTRRTKNPVPWSQLMKPYLIPMMTSRYRLRYAKRQSRIFDSATAWSNAALWRLSKPRELTRILMIRRRTTSSDRHRRITRQSYAGTMHRTKRRCHGATNCRA